VLSPALDEHLGLEQRVERFPFEHPQREAARRVL
jgi:hypothetical protein